MRAVTPTCDSRLFSQSSTASIIKAVKLLKECICPTAAKRDFFHSARAGMKEFLSKEICAGMKIIKRFWWIPVILILATGGYLYYRNTQAQARRAACTATSQT